MASFGSSSTSSWNLVVRFASFIIVLCHLKSLVATSYHQSSSSQGQEVRGYQSQHHPLQFQQQQQQQTQQQQPQRNKQQRMMNSRFRDAIDENAKHKCVIEVPTISLTADNYPHYRNIRKGSTHHFSLIETCCEGYRASRLHGSTLCLPVCDNCRNGYCTAPNECQCYSEFVPNDNGDCVFTCPLGCLNGRCYLDGSCKCDQGYKLDETRKFCRPICSEGCAEEMRQNCTEPETCGCSKGYTLRDNGCEPTCNPECGIGGTCTEPNVCTCNHGHILKGSVCQADCYQKCDHGVCLSKHRCICNAGYRYHEKTMTCIPV